MKLFPPPVAKGLTDKEYHDVNLQKTKHRVRVTPFVNGKISNLEVSICQEATVHKAGKKEDSLKS